MDDIRTRTIINSFDDGNIQITTEMLRRDSKTQEDIVVLLTREIINTKEDRVKQALIELGWTPPKED